MENTIETPAPRTRADIARENGAKSRGPVTPAGKAASSRNSTKHGLLARTIVLPTESKKRFARLLNLLRKELAPQTEIERHLVDRMAVARWHQMRCWGYERSVVAHELSRQAAATPDLELETDSTRAALIIRQSDGHSRFVDRVSYLAGRYQRDFDRALNTFRNGRNANSAQTNPQTPLKTNEQERS